MKHSLVVGMGLAGLAYAEQLRRKGLSFHVIDKGYGGSSKIAAGIYNPTVLKRFSLAWNGDLFHSYALPFYNELQDHLQSEFIFPTPIHKIFSKVSEHNSWVVASNQNSLSPFLDPQINSIINTEIKGVYGYGKVNHTGRIATQTLINDFVQSLKTNQFSEETFEYNKLLISNTVVEYKGIKAKHIVFCEGYQMVNNPFFNSLPLVGSKGEILIIKTKQLQSKPIIKASIFLAPMGDDLYWAGATFERNDKTLKKTLKGREWIEERIQKIIASDYEVVDHITEIRPTVMDRRPLLGTHPDYYNVHLLNGFGTRGVLGAPLLSKWLLDYIMGQFELPEIVNLRRF
ncbi:MAG: FAD-dependent oxidoreductase [Flavobacteriaceae bacterium]|nr:FAD-dependent oxidoreductase [Flavobacteriaceae bacterium]